MGGVLQVLRAEIVEPRPRAAQGVETVVTGVGGLGSTARDDGPETGVIPAVTRVDISSGGTNSNVSVIHMRELPHIEDRVTVPRSLIHARLPALARHGKGVGHTQAHGEEQETRSRHHTPFVH